MSQFDSEGALAACEEAEPGAGAEGGADPRTQQRRVTALYVSNAGQGTVSTLHLHADGRLSEVQRLQVGGSLVTMAVHPNRRTLYVVRRGEPSAVISLAIDPHDGRLSAVMETRLPASMVSLHVCSTGRYLLAASCASHLVAVCDIASDGLPQAPHQIVHNVPKAHCARMWQGHRRAVVAGLGTDKLLAYRFDDKRGLLDPASVQHWRLPFHAGPRHLEWHPSLNVFFLLHELDGQLHVLEADGMSLHHRQQVSGLPTLRPAPNTSGGLRVTPDGRFLFAIERTGGMVSSYRIHASSGRLSWVGHWPVQQQPQALQVDPQSRYLLVTSQSSDQVGVHAIGDGGGLTPLRETALGAHPSGMEIVQMPAA
jgi:6-phosphogluconolactonase